MKNTFTHLIVAKLSFLLAETCRAEHIYPLVAERMAFLHQQHEKILQLGSCTGVVKPMLWDKIRKFIALSPQEFPDDPVKQEKYIKEQYKFLLNFL